MLAMKSARLALVLLGGIFPHRCAGLAACFRENEGWRSSGVIDLGFQPAFLSVQKLGDPQKESLVITSFYNAHPNPDYNASDPTSLPLTFFERDLVARIPDLSGKSISDMELAVEVLTDQALPLLTENSILEANTIFPNDATRAPDGIFDFEALVISQGFHPAIKPGRLTILDLSNPDPVTGYYPEYIVDQSTESAPRFYHQIAFADMNLDGLQDIVTVRSTFRVFGSFFPPEGQLVWFEQPTNYTGSEPWTVHALYDMPFPGSGPDIGIDTTDFDNDGVPEFVTTEFFGDGTLQGGKITVFGIPQGFDSWVGVGAEFGPSMTRAVDVSTDQGLPFGIKLTDLNDDGHIDILATNHQGVEEFASTPGRVYAIEAPTNISNLYDASQWNTHILLDNIRPYPNLPGTTPPGRLAPGTASPFYRSKFSTGKPWIVAGGDESGKAWILRPASSSEDDWTYNAEEIFDINDVFGEDTTQTVTEDGITISTIGKATVYHNPKRCGLADVFIPVFEAKQIHRYSYYKKW